MSALMSPFWAPSAAKFQGQAHILLAIPDLKALGLVATEPMICALDFSAPFVVCGPLQPLEDQTGDILLLPSQDAAVLTGTWHFASSFGRAFQLTLKHHAQSDLRYLLQKRPLDNQHPIAWLLEATAQIAGMDTAQTFFHRLVKTKGSHIWQVHVRRLLQLLTQGHSSDAWALKHARHQLWRHLPASWRPLKTLGWSDHEHRIEGFLNTMEGNEQKFSIKAYKNAAFQASEALRLLVPDPYKQGHISIDGHALKDGLLHFLEALASANPTQPLLEDEDLDRLHITYLFSPKLLSTDGPMAIVLSSQDVLDLGKKSTLPDRWYAQHVILKDGQLLSQGDPFEIPQENSVISLAGRRIVMWNIEQKEAFLQWAQGITPPEHRYIFINKLSLLSATSWHDIGTQLELKLPKTFQEAALPIAFAWARRVGSSLFEKIRR